MGRRSRTPERVRPLDDDLVADKLDLVLPFSDPGREALVRRGDVPRPHAPPRARVRSAVPVRRGVLRSQGRALVVSGSVPHAHPRHRKPWLHRVGARPRTGRAGHDVTGLDTCFYEGCDFGDDLAAIPTTRRDVRDVTVADFQGATPSSTSPPCRTTRSATSTSAGRTRSTSTRRFGLRARPRRRACGGSCSPRRARCTAPPEPTSSWTRTLRCGR